MKNKFLLLLGIVLISFTFISARPLTCSDDGIVSLWKFDDGSGTTALDSCGVNTGTVGGTENWATGKFDGDFDFDGTTNYINIGNDSSLIPSTNDFSISIWVRTTDTGTKGLFDFYDNFNYGEYQVASYNGLVEFYVSDDANYPYIDATTPVNDGEWHHIVAVRDGQDLYLYIDGVLEANENSTGLGDIQITNPDAIATIGTFSYNPVQPQYNLYGEIDDVAFFNKALSPAEILNIYEEAAPIPPAGGGAGLAQSFDVNTQYIPPTEQTPTPTIFSTLGINPINTEGIKDWFNDNQKTILIIGGIVLFIYLFGKKR